jgi:hypothetical protein
MADHPPKPIPALSWREAIALLMLLALAIGVALPELRHTYLGAFLTGACQSCWPPNVPPGL